MMRNYLKPPKYLHSAPAPSRVSLFIPVILLAAASGCMTTLDGEPVNLISTQDEVKLGAQMASQVELQEEVLANPKLHAYVSEVGARLAALSPRQDVQYSFKVIDSPDTINAFALPGGYMYVYTGLLKFCSNEAELASVMAHEIAHVAAHHHGQSMTRQYGIQIISDMILGENPHTAARVVRDLLGTGVMMRFSRGNEREADMLGMNILARAGYNPDAMVVFMQKLAAQEQGGYYLPIFASHPATQERMLYLQSMAQQYPVSIRQSTTLFAERYSAQALSLLK